MTNLQARKPFLEGTASLFTSEKTANARNKVVELMNEMPMADANKKLEMIGIVKETVLYSDTELLDEFIDDLLAFSHDTTMDVRKAIMGFVEEVSKVNIVYLPKIVNVSMSLLRDDSVQIIKRVIQACGAIYKNALKWICTLSDITDDVETAWNTLCIIKDQIFDMIDNDNDGIRTNAIKFLEQVIILQTYPDEDSMKRENDFSLEDIPMTMKIIRRRKLEEEAIRIFDALVKFHAASHISSVNLIACTGTLCTVAKMRPSVMNSVVEALKNLHANLPPTLTNSQVSSVRKHLKMQFLNLLKHPATYEQQASIIQILTDLGASHSEITKAIPKLDKHELQRRAKRAAKFQIESVAAKKIKLEKEKVLGLSAVPQPREMEIDLDEIAEQKNKSNKLNETFVLDNLKTVDTVVQMVILFMKHLPDEVPAQFLQNYVPVVNQTLPQQLQKIAQLLGQQMTEKVLGPGATAITKDPPMKLKISVAEERNIIMSAKSTNRMVTDEVDLEEDDDDDRLLESLRKDEATKKLRETLERVKGEQANAPKMKQRVKALKLQEVTKVLSRDVKNQFLLSAVQRILKAERSSIVGGVAAKRRRVLTVMASTFTNSVREEILNYIMLDVQKRLDLAFSWLYEEYSLFQGFTRHTYIKSEHKPDHAYNSLLMHILQNVVDRPDFRDKETILRRVYLESPLLSDESIKLLASMCTMIDLSNCSLNLIKDLIIRRPPKQPQMLTILLTLAVHNNVVVREKALEILVEIFNQQPALREKVEAFALKWLGFLRDSSPADEMFSIQYERIDALATWNEDLGKICLGLYMAILPLKEELIHKISNVYKAATADTKRLIFRMIEVPIKQMGTDSNELLRFMEECPEDVETLVTRIIRILTEKATPTPELVELVRNIYNKQQSNKKHDVRLLIPVLTGLTKKEVLAALPDLIKLNPVMVKEVFSRLLGIGPDNKTVMSPLTSTELLVALHTIDTAKAELKFVVKATSLCLAEKEKYTHETLGVVMQQLVEMTPLPTLLMRTMLQSLTLHPRLAGFVTNLLQKLILKQVWKQKVVWDGFLKCCQRLQPQSLNVLIQLPPLHLQDALRLCPDLRDPLYKHTMVMIDSKMGNVSDLVMNILLGYDIDALAAGEDMVMQYTSPDLMNMMQPIQIKQEKEEQPLPPGME